MGLKVVERPIHIEEVLKAFEEGKLHEAFGTGTAISITIIDEIAYKEDRIEFPDSNEIGLAVLNRLDGIKTGKLEDKFNWMLRIQNQMA